MQDLSRILYTLTQHEKLFIMVRSNRTGLPSDELIEKFMQPHKQAQYFFLFMKKGHALHKVDMQPINVQNNQLLFVLPQQIHILPSHQHEWEYYKLGIDDHCLSLLPKSFPFLINPLQHQILSIKEDAVQRLSWAFESLRQLLLVRNSPTALILSYLDSVLTEINHAYFQDQEIQSGSNEKLTKYIAFKLLVEEELTQHLSIEEICKRLAVNATHLYNIVKEFSGLSAKEYLNQRLILEAQRKLYYNEISVKEVAFELGFNDPDYFSRLFRKITGNTVSRFVSSIRDLSGN
jgi:AraC-type DNA-binding domain-containing proteins